MTDDDANIELWHSGIIANRDGKPCPTEPHAKAGWLHREREKRVLRLRLRLRRRLRRFHRNRKASASGSSR